MKTTKLLLLALTMAGMIFTSCKKDNENSTNCWLLHVQYKEQSESMYFWGSEIEASAALDAFKTMFSKELPTGAKIVGIKDITTEFNNEQVCKAENDVIFGHEEKCWEVEFIPESGATEVTYIWGTEDDIDTQIEILRVAHEIAGNKIKETKKSLSQVTTMEDCLNSNKNNK